ncbi:MAG: polyprenyl synthetase family protein [bacterium]
MKFNLGGRNATVGESSFKELKMRRTTKSLMQKAAVAADSFALRQSSLSGPAARYLPALRAGQLKQRSALGLLVYRLVAKPEEWEKANALLAPIFGFMEVSTAATYVLDDIIDSQPERDGEPATHIKFGVPDAIIAGGIQTFAALGMLDAPDTWGNIKAQLLKLGVDMWQTLWQGEEHNERMTHPVTVREYILRCYEICGVMYETVATMVTIVALHDPLAADSQTWCARELGRYFGIAVMIRNDLTCFVPEDVMRRRSKALARPAGEDVKKGLYTYPVLYAIRHASSPQRRIIRGLLGEPEITAEELAVLTQVLEETGAIRATLDLITRYKKKCQEMVNVLALAGHQVGSTAGAADDLRAFIECLENMRSGYFVSLG